MLSEVVRTKRDHIERPGWKKISLKSPEFKVYWVNFDRLILRDDILYINYLDPKHETFTLRAVVPKLIRLHS